jgi:hypothetical protein
MDGIARYNDILVASLNDEGNDINKVYLMTSTSATPGISV